MRPGPEVRQFYWFWGCLFKVIKTDTCNTFTSQWHFLLPRSGCWVPSLKKRTNERLPVLNTILYRNIITQNIPVRDEELRDHEYNAWALTVSGYSSATEALARERWRFSQMGQASGWGWLHSSVFENRENKSLHHKRQLVFKRPTLGTSHWHVT